MNRDLELKRAIIDWLFENKDMWNRVNSCMQHFREYIYNSDGGYLIGGENVSDFISNIDKVIFSNND